MISLVSATSGPWHDPCVTSPASFCGEKSLSLNLPKSESFSTSDSLHIDGVPGRHVM